MVREPLAFKVEMFSQFSVYFQTRDDFMQMMMNAPADNSEDKQDDKEHDKDFKEVYGNLGKRRKDLFTPIERERENEKDQRTMKNDQRISDKHPKKYSLSRSLSFGLNIA